MKPFAIAGIQMNVSAGQFGLYPPSDPLSLFLDSLGPFIKPTRINKIPALAN